MKRFAPLVLLASLGAMAVLSAGCGAETEATEQQEEEIRDLAERGVNGSPEAAEAMGN